MRPPILFLTIAFGVGLWGGLGPSPGRGAWYVVAPLLVAATLLHRRAPLGAAVGLMGVAGMLWGAAAVRERERHVHRPVGGRGKGQGRANPRGDRTARGSRAGAGRDRGCRGHPRGVRGVGAIALAGRHWRSGRDDLGGGGEVERPARG